MSSTPSKPAFPPRGNANGFVTFFRKIYNPLGFKHGYNFPLFVILVGALLGFSLSRFMLLDVGGTFLKVSPRLLHKFAPSTHLLG